MTLIAALVDKDGSVWMAGDSAGTRNDHVAVREDPKVWVNGEMVLGFAGSFRARDLLQYSLDLTMPNATEDLDAYMRTTFIAAVKDAYRKGGFLGKYQQGNESQFANIIVGIRGRIFTVHGDYAVGSTVGEFETIGSGAQVANGSLYATRGFEDSRARLAEAMDAAVYFVSGVRPPYHYIRTQAMPVAVAA